MSENRVCFYCDNKHRRIPALIAAAVLTLSCRIYDNPVDSAATNFIGYEAAFGQTVPKPLFPQPGQNLYYPAFRWGSCKKDSVYQIQAATEADFNEESLCFNQTLSGQIRLGLTQFKMGREWPSDETDRIFSNLPIGTYWWRVRVKNALTQNRWGVWSAAVPFRQKMHLKKMLLDRQGNDFESGYRYSYTPDRSWEREAMYTVSDGVGAEAGAYQEHSLTFNRLSSDGLLLETNQMAEPENKSPESRVIYEYQQEASGRVLQRLRYQTIEKGKPLSQKRLIGKEVYFYEGHPKRLVRIESRTINDRKQTLNYISYYEGEKQVKTVFYTSDSNGKAKVLYYYFMEYDTDFPDYPITAKYYDEKEQYLNSYTMEYNFPEIPTLVIRPGTSVQLEGQQPRANGRVVPLFIGNKK